MKRFHLSLLLLLALAASIFPARAQSTAFHYSGQLEADGVALNGYYDFIFTLTTAALPPDPATAPALPWSGMESLTRMRVPVSNGTFTVALDYGPVPFDGMDLVIGIQVRTNFVLEMVPNPPPGRDCS